MGPMAYGSGVRVCVPPGRQLPNWLNVVHGGLYLILEFPVK